MSKHCTYCYRCYRWNGEHASDCPEYQVEVESHEVDELRAQIETLNLQLAACMTAALGNTASSVEERITPGHPYYSGSYRAVCEAVDREMLHRNASETLREQQEAARETLLALLLDTTDRSVKGSLK